MKKTILAILAAAFLTGCGTENPAKSESGLSFMRAPVPVNNFGLKQNSVMTVVLYRFAVTGPGRIPSFEFLLGEGDGLQVWNFTITVYENEAFFKPVMNINSGEDYEVVDQPTTILVRIIPKGQDGSSGLYIPAGQTIYLELKAKIQLLPSAPSPPLEVEPQGIIKLGKEFFKV